MSAKKSEAADSSALNISDSSSPSIFNWKRSLLYPILGTALLTLLALGAMANNGWLPHTDSLSGKRTGWFGRELQSNNISSSSSAASLLPFEPSPSSPTSTPQLSKEYIYAGSRMLAVEDANANAAPPADLAVWRPGNGTWYVINSSNQQMTSLQWGVQGDSPVQGDYDGDGKTDFSVFRPSATPGVNSNWYLTYSNNGSWAGIPFGTKDDVPAVADYDGDGKTDIAVFRGDNGLGYWFYLRSSDGVLVSFQFGVATDKAIPRDFDGDGKSDVTVWRESAGTFYTVRSSDNLLQTQTGGQAGDIQVSADYDGDGKADYAVRRGADWLYVQSTNGAVQLITWQQAGDKEVQNDYDGDGKVDIAVWRPSNGTWYIRQSHDNSLRQVQWGQSGDIPVPALYRR
jgi:hypothetical protein